MKLLSLTFRKIDEKLCFIEEKGTRETKENSRKEYFIDLARNNSKISLQQFTPDNSTATERHTGVTYSRLLRRGETIIAISGLKYFAN